MVVLIFVDVNVCIVPGPRQTVTNHLQVPLCILQLPQPQKGFPVGQIQAEFPPFQGIVPITRTNYKWVDKLGCFFKPLAPEKIRGLGQLLALLPFGRQFVEIA